MFIFNVTLFYCFFFKKKTESLSVAYEGINQQSSCLSFSGAHVTYVHHHTQR